MWWSVGIVLRDRPEGVDADVELDGLDVHARTSAIRSSSSGVKCSPAVGAAAERSSREKTVW